MRVQDPCKRVELGPCQCMNDPDLHVSFIANRTLWQKGEDFLGGVKCLGDQPNCLNVSEVGPEHNGAVDQDLSRSVER